MQSRTDGMQLWGGENEIHGKARIYVHATQKWYAITVVVYARERN